MEFCYDKGGRLSYRGRIEMFLPLKLHTIMVQGDVSHVGKSITVCALCPILKLEMR